MFLIPPVTGGRIRPDNPSLQHTESDRLGEDDQHRQVPALVKCSLLEPAPLMSLNRRRPEVPIMVQTDGRERET